jgi:hypothetical protein
MSILPIDPLPTTDVKPTRTATAILPNITDPADGTRSCTRGQPRCPAGYVCRQKGTVADLMFCYVEKVNIPTPSPSPAGQVCGGFAGVECPVGFTCDIPEEMDGAVVNDAQGTCRADASITR